MSFLCLSVYPSIVAYTFIILMRNDSYPRWHDSTDTAECAVVLVIVRDNNQALLLLCQYELDVVLYIGPSLFKRGINVVRREIDDVEAVLQVAHHTGNLLIGFLLLIDGDKLRHTKRRGVESFALGGTEVVQTVAVGLKPCVTTVGTNQNIGVHEDVIRVE